MKYEKRAGVKRTNEEFLKIANHVNPHIEILSEYIDYDTAIEYRHLECGYSASTRCYSLMEKFECPSCKRDMKKIETVKNIVEKYDDLQFVNYDKYTKRVTCKSLDCGHVFSKSEVQLRRNGICTLCNKDKIKEMYKSSHDEFVEKVDIMYGKGEYVFLEEYTLCRIPLLVRHVCGHEYKVKPNNIISGKQCPNCMKIKSSMNRRTSHEEFEVKLKNKLGEKFTLLSKYEKATELIKVKHNSENCNYYEFETTPVNLLHRHSCPKCSFPSRYTTEYFKEIIKDKYGEEFEVLSEVNNAKQSVVIRHNTCGKEINTHAHSLLYRDYECGYCIDNSSKGERRVREYLDDIGFQYIEQLRFDDCKYKKRLSFDFALYKNDELFCLIEFDGKQHYETIEYFGGEEGLKSIQLRDSIKNKYCYDKNIRLLRIPYWEYNIIPEVIDSFINNKNLIYSNCYDGFREEVITTEIIKIS